MQGGPSGLAGSMVMRSMGIPNFAVQVNSTGRRRKRKRYTSTLILTRIIGY
jgi:hypothetical protein